MRTTTEGGQETKILGTLGTHQDFSAAVLQHEYGKYYNVRVFSVNALFCPVLKIGNFQDFIQQ